MIFIDYVADDEEIKEQRDRVCIAFRKFDLDNDGYLSWYEFTQVSTGCPKKMVFRISALYGFFPFMFGVPTLKSKAAKSY